MTPEQKLASIKIFAERALKIDPNATLNAQWLLNHINFQSSPFTGQDDPDMERVIKHDMQLHAADCETNKKNITREYKGCNCWLADPPKSVYSSFYIRPKAKATKLNVYPFHTYRDALGWIISNTTFSNYPEFPDYWGHAYEIIEKEPTTK